MQKSVIVENLSKNYFKKEAVKEISFTINENEILGLLGPNGCGKTTTIAMMLGLLKPSNGRVVIHGLDIEKNRISLLHKMNFISPYIELPKKLSVKENLIVYCLSEYRYRKFERGISLFDKNIKINFKKNKLILSEKDKKNYTISEFKKKIGSL